MQSQDPSCTACPHKLDGACAAFSLGTGAARFAPSYAHFKTRTFLIRPDVEHASLAILCTGFAAKIFLLPNGDRQILSLRRPARFVLGGAAFARRSKFAAVALTDVTVAYLPKSAVLQAIAYDVSIVTKLADKFEQENAEIADLVIDLGRRDAQGRIAHLLWNIVRWAAPNGRSNSGSAPLPLRQEDIADYTGLTATHVNRVLAAMRKEGLIAVAKDIVTVPDLDRLKASFE